MIDLHIVGTSETSGRLYSNNKITIYYNYIQRRDWLTYTFTSWYADATKKWIEISSEYLQRIWSVINVFIYVYFFISLFIHHLHLVTGR